jgi:hypothetical protein
MHKLLVLIAISDGTKKESRNYWSRRSNFFFPSKNLGCYGDGGAILLMMMLWLTNYAE